MKTNVLKAIISLIENKIYNINEYTQLNYKIRINNVGEALENLVKDALCNNFNLDINERILKQNEYFSYLGNQNNPPDLIIKNGDAFEIKKIETSEGSIALNSSYPKDKLYSHSNMITEACRTCEDSWVEKDICYIIGCIDSQKNIKNIWFIYGDCYCAKPHVYEKVKSKITNGIIELGIELNETNEIARIKKIDPLGITDLRFRGMWNLQHPSKVFEYITEKSDIPYIKLLILLHKYNAFNQEDRIEIEKVAKVKLVKIKNPNNPASLLDAVLIEYEFIK